MKVDGNFVYLHKNFLNPSFSNSSILNSKLKKDGH